MSGKGKITVDGKQITCRIQTWRERERILYRNKQAGAKTRWVRYIAVHYWLHPSFRGVSWSCSELGVNVGDEIVGFSMG